MTRREKCISWAMEFIMRANDDADMYPAAAEVSRSAAKFFWAEALIQ